MINDVVLDLAEHLRTHMLGPRLREKMVRRAVRARKKLQSRLRESSLLYRLVYSLANPLYLLNVSPASHALQLVMRPN